MKIKTEGIKKGIMHLSMLLILPFSGCITVGPDYIPPETDIPVKWSSALSENMSAISDMSPAADWWKSFNDPLLSDLIKRAAANNLSIREASIRLEQARIRRGISEADKYPEVTSSASAKKSRTAAGSSNSYNMGLDSSWEIDLFGKIRRSIEASDADIGSAIESLNDTVISLVAEVALNYVNLRLYQAELENTSASLKLQEETYEIISWRYQAGLVTELDLKSAEYSLEQTKSQIPALQSNIDQAQNSIAVLLGCNPGTLEEELTPIMPVPFVTDTEIKTGIPADILRQRPDLRKAERDIAAQTARIGAAEADLYPRITLSGSIGVNASQLSGLSDSDSLSRSIGPSITWPVFNSGSVKRNVMIQSSEAEQLRLQYKALVLNAFEEVENAISSCFYEQQKRKSLNKAVNAAERSFELSRMQYTSGLVDFQNLLEAQRTLLSLQDQLIQSRGQITINYITLFKALGGGWSSGTTDL